MSRPPGYGGDWSSANDDGWGNATTVRGGTPRGGSDRSSGRSSGRDSQQPKQQRAPRRASEVDADGWSSGPASSDRQRANRAAEKQHARSVREMQRERDMVAQAPQRGVRSWVALVVVFVIAIVGGLIDTIGAIEIQGGFNVGIVVASVVGVLIVKRSGMFPLVIAPPIVYTLGAGVQYYLKSSGGNSSQAKFNAATNYLVYGFPAIAIASAAVLIIAGVRMILRK